MAGSKPLARGRVLHLGRAIAPPWRIQMLGEMGADIVRVERRGTGHELRARQPDREGRRAAGQGGHLCRGHIGRSLHGYAELEALRTARAFG